MMPNRSSRSRAFTLVEILIVVVILGILAAIVIPQFTSASQEAARSSFVTSLKQLVTAAELYRNKEGEYVADSSSGVFPPEFAEYVRVEDFESGTPIGGVWDFEFEDTAGVTSAVGVHFNGDGETRDDAYMVQIDALFDDGDLEAGAFQRLAAGRYYYIITE